MLICPNLKAGGAERQWALLAPSLAERGFEVSVMTLMAAASISVFSGKDAPVDPNSGAVVERLFDPYELTERIGASGFSVRVAGYWGGAGGNPLIGLANAVLARARLTIGAAHAFTIAARRL